MKRQLHSIRVTSFTIVLFNQKKSYANFTVLSMLIAIRFGKHVYQNLKNRHSYWHYWSFKSILSTFKLGLVSLRWPLLDTFELKNVMISVLYANFVEKAVWEQVFQSGNIDKKFWFLVRLIWKEKIFISKLEIFCFLDNDLQVGFEKQKGRHYLLLSSLYLSIWRLINHQVILVVTFSFKLFELFKILFNYSKSITKSPVHFTAFQFSWNYNLFWKINYRSKIIFLLTGLTPNF